MARAVDRLRMATVWLSRIHLCRGFGIQSPWAYAFVRYVVNEHYEYYGYGDVERANPCLAPCTVRLGRLYLRLANRVQPNVIVSYGQSATVYGQYFHAGCHGAEIVNIPSCAEKDSVSQTLNGIKTIGILRLTLEGNYLGVFEEACLKAREDSVFIIEGIKRDAEAKRFWRETVLPLSGTITFDLYYCGLVCFKSKMFKRNYKVNF